MRRRAVLLQAAATGALLAFAAPAVAQPIGAQVIAGQASVQAPSATSTIINQSTSKAIINWQNFSVAAGASVQFNQPDSASLTLNRVVGGGLSAIDGAIKANGQVWLINPNGVLFGQGAQVHVGGLLASTSDIANADFLSGNYAFAGAPAGSSVVNKGALQAASGGTVILSAPNVSNSGLITATAGHVVLGGADAFTVDFKGDHLLSYAVTAPAHGAGASNSGIIKAPGGTVVMTARAATQIANGVVNNSGVIEATSARLENGEIVLDAGDGEAVNSGTLDVSGRNAGESGGAVRLVGKTVTVADGATIDVSGDAGGGTAAIGGNLHGVGPGPNAQTVTVGKASIRADAITSGNGGTVAVYGAGQTSVAASISARGGATSGNGGQIETSGKDLRIDDAVSISTSAVNGTVGNWLLDPKNITVANTGTDGTTQTFATTGNNVTIAPATIGIALNTNSVTLQANTDITIVDSISAIGGANTLTLQAGRTIALTNGSSITNTNGTVVLSANDPGANAGDRTAGAAFITSGSTGGVSAARLDLILNSNGGDGSLIGASSFSPFLVTGGTPTYVDTAGANVYLTSGNGVATSFTLGNSAHANAVEIGAGSLGLTAGGVTQVGPVLLSNFTLSLPASTSTGNPVLLDNTGNAITGTVNINVMGGVSGTDYVKVVNSQALTVGTISNTPNIVSPTGRGGLTLKALTGDLTLTGNVDASQITLTATTGAINQTSGRIDSHSAADNSLGGSVALTAGTSITLTNANNVIEQTVASTGNGNQTAVTHAGQLTFSSGGAANIQFASRIDLYAASAGGALTLTTVGSYNLNDAGGNSFKNYNEIDIYSPVTATGLLTLHASGDILSELSSARDTHLAGASLAATSDNGALTLGDIGHASISGGPVDIGNQISGVVNLVAGGGDAGFLNNVNFATHLGTSSAAGVLQVLSKMDLVLDPAATLTSTLGSGTSVILAPLGNFINNSGSTAVQVQNGARWLIYSAAPTNDVFGGLNSNNTAIWNWNKTIPFAVAASGNRYVFATNATLTVAANNQTKTYGTDVSSSIAGGYTITGLQPGFANAFLGDTSAVFSGAPSLSTSGAVASAPVSGSTYTIAVAQGSFAATNGYNVQLQNGALTVNPATLTYTAAAASRTYGAGNPAFSGTVTGFVNGETQSSATTGIASFSSSATSGSAAGSYAIDGAGLSAANYSFQQAASNPTALTINPASLLYVANATSRTYGATNPSLSGTVTGFVNGDTQASATTGILGFTSPGTGATTSVGSYAITGIGLTPNGNYTLTQAAANATALTINAALLTYTANSTSRTYGGGNPAFSGTVTGFVNGETQSSATTGTLAFTSPATSASAVGSHAINGAGLSATNYVFTQATGNAAALTINRATLTYAASSTSRAYGAANSALGGIVTGFVNSDTQASATTGALSFTSPATSASAVGSYAINGTGLAASNYTFVQATGNATALTINQASLLYVANPVSRIYGSANPAISGSVTGFVNGDTQSSATTGSASFSTAATATSGVGIYAINGAGLTVTNGNYVLQQAAGNAGALVITPAILTYTTGSATRVYGAANPAFSGTVSGFVNSETQSTATTGTLVFASQAGSGANVGKYAINGSGLGATNYVFQQAAANATALSITPKALTVSLQGTVTKVFDGTTLATLDVANYNVQGLVNGDIVYEVPTISTYDTPDIGIGKTVTITGLVLDSGNYILSNTTASAAIGIITAGIGGTGSNAQNTQVVATSVANQNANEPTRPGTFYLDTGATLTPPPASDVAPAPVPVTAVLTPAAVNPIAELVSEDSSAGTGAEPVSPADQASDFLVASMEGGGRSPNGVVIPGLLRTGPRTRGNGGVINNLSAWGNPALWQ